MNKSFETFPLNGPAIAAVLLFSFVGLAGSAYLFNGHVLNRGEKESFCDVSETVNCDIVNESPWGKLYGVPVSGIGLAYYGALAALHLAAKRKAVRGVVMWTLLWTMVFGGWAYAMYLTYIEARVLQAWCMVCVSSAVSITIILFVSTAAYGRRLPGMLRGKDAT